MNFELNYVLGTELSTTLILEEYNALLGALERVQNYARYSLIAFPGRCHTAISN